MSIQTFVAAWEPILGCGCTYIHPCLASWLLSQSAMVLVIRQAGLHSIQVKYEGSSLLHKGARKNERSFFLVEFECFLPNSGSSSLAKPEC